MGLVDQHQSAGLCLQPEASQANPHDCQNNSAILSLPDPFFPTHTQKKKKQSGYSRLQAVGPSVLQTFSLCAVKLIIKSQDP